MKYNSIGDKVFVVFNYLILGLLGISTLYPFFHVFLISINNTSSVYKTGLSFAFFKPSFQAYRQILSNPYIGLAMFNTVTRTVVGTFVNVILTVAVAYPLSKKNLPFRNFFTGLMVFTMFFSGGLIPTFLLVKSLGLTNTRLALILPGAINTFNMIIVRNYFMSLPAELEESAKIDGANDIKILFKIIIPISLPIIATITLWYAVYHWNSWFDALIYTTKPNLIVLQSLLQKMIIEGSGQYLGTNNARMIISESGSLSTESIKSATIMVSSIPIIMVYPFVQKYFIQGIMVGSLKG